MNNQKEIYLVWDNTDIILERGRVMNKMIYLDNAATTPVRTEVVDAMMPYFTELFGNPSSIYGFSAKSKEAVTKARDIIAKSLRTDSKNI